MCISPHHICPALGRITMERQETVTKYPKFLITQREYHRSLPVKLNHSSSPGNFCTHCHLISLSHFPLSHCASWNYSPSKLFDPKYLSPDLLLRIPNLFFGGEGINILLFNIGSHNITIHRVSNPNSCASEPRHLVIFYQLFFVL